MNNCGQYTGWLNHRSANTPACEFCKRAKAKHDAGTVEVAPIRSAQQVAQCGSVSGYKKHRRNGEAACAPCREAANKDARDRKAAKRGGTAVRGRPIAHPCGTPAAARRHQVNKEPLCDPCAAALIKYNAELYQKRKAKKAEAAK